jgi:hypothetical protein
MIANKGASGARWFCGIAVLWLGARLAPLPLQAQEAPGPTREALKQALYELKLLADKAARAGVKIDLQFSSIQNLSAGAAARPDGVIELGPYEWVVLRINK